MNSRERVKKVINHEIPDYVPNGLGGCETAGMHVLTYDRFQQVLEIERKAPRLNTFMVNAVFEEELINKMEGDIILVSSPRMCSADLRGAEHTAQWKEQQLWGKTFQVSKKEIFNELEDGSVIWETGNHVICPKGSYFFSEQERTDLLGEIETPDPNEYKPSHELSEKMLRNLEETAKQLYEETRLSLCLGETITDLQIQPGGMVGSMILMIEEPEIMHEYLQKSAEAALAQLKMLDQAVGKYVDILSIAHDFGDNRGITIGAPLWREIYKPHYKKLFQGWKKTTDMKINLHSCGAVSEILGDFVECGLDIFNPVQTSANGMGAVELKEKFGKDLIFWGGGYDSQLFNPSEDYHSVYETVKSTIQVLKKDGGFIFSGVHNLPAEMSEIHLKAMLEAWKNTRYY